MNLIKLEERVNSAVRLSDTATIAIADFEKRMGDCQALQKERLSRAETNVARIETKIEELSTKIDEDKDHCHKIELDIKDKQTSFNLLLSNVNDLIHSKNKMEDRLSKLVLTIVGALLVLLMTKCINEFGFLQYIDKPDKAPIVQVDKSKD